MAKITLYASEVYPVYWTDSGEETRENVEVDDDTLKRWSDTIAAWEKVQNEMQRAIESAGYSR